MDYQLKPIGKHCHATGEPLVPGSRCRSTLIERGGQLVRLDFLEQAWPGVPEGALADWTCQVPAPETNLKPVLDADSLLEMFEQMVEEASPSRARLCYVLGLLLIQKRRLRIDDTRTDEDGDLLVLSGSRGEGPFELREQSLTESEIEQLQAQLTNELSVGQ